VVDFLSSLRSRLGGDSTTDPTAERRGPRLLRYAAKKAKGVASPAKDHNDSDPVVVELRAALTPDRVRCDGAERSLLSRDASVFDGGVSGPVCFPTNTAEVQAIMRIALKHERNIVPRGAGTGLSGGAIPLGAPIVVVVTKMNEIVEVDVDNRIAWVEPGVVNLDLTRYLHRSGFHFAPDPSSQQVCTIGGNVANNSGGPHCLAYGVTNAHVQALEVVLPSGEIVMLGGLDAEPAGLDLGVRSSEAKAHSVLPPRSRSRSLRTLQLSRRCCCRSKLCATLRTP
jgi:hypothetical protein